jgi:two-component system sensor histidine kinase NblS
VDLAQAIEQTLRIYQLNARDKGIELVQEVASNLPSVVGNYDLLLQVFTNLVGNALKFTKAGGRVAIRTYPHSGASSSYQKTSQVRIEVSDTGMGIDPEHQEKILVAFPGRKSGAHFGGHWTGAIDCQKYYGKASY